MLQATDRLSNRSIRQLPDDMLLRRRIAQKQKEKNWLQRSVDIGVAAVGPGVVVVAFPRGGHLRIGIDAETLDSMQEIKKQRGGPFAAVPPSS